MLLLKALSGLLVLCEDPTGRRMRSANAKKGAKILYGERGRRSLTRLSLDPDVSGEISSCSKEMVEAFRDNPIALTGGLFETASVNDGNFAALIAD